ncbi:TonB-dependent receptor [uncultured Pedobacter sp.]|uniref:SusC/RagA family TonB-linked outer membrane protein n=1 Tax=uncultured Pedobacter sp. TaxID=246139 RepID=UPI0025D53BDE|nr:TonB-dependent receptor [uncultured Pedobacter sp.]
MNYFLRKAIPWTRIKGAAFALFLILFLQNQSYAHFTKADKNKTNNASAAVIIPSTVEKKTLNFFKHTVTGRVTDEKNQPLPSVTVLLKGTKTGASTDPDGRYKISVPDHQDTLVFKLIGYETQEIAVKGESIINVRLTGKSNELNEVSVVVAYGTQKKTTLVGSVTSINPKEIKGPTSNLTTMLAGRIPGVISYQRSGEPGADNAQFFVRGVGTFGAGKVDPLILIDGIESTTTDLARLQPDDISGFSVLKDAAASSLYGARGANGVILIATKTGGQGRTKFNFRLENSISTNTQNFALADNITYMNLANEAVLTRNPLGSLPYSQNKIDHTAAGDNPYLYPNNNWIHELIKDYTSNRRFNMNASGGSERAKYYLAMTYNTDNGILKNNELNNFNNNIKLNSYSLLSNITLNFTKSTEALVSLKGQFDNYNGPIGGGSAVFSNALYSNPVAFPAIYPSSYLPYATHPLFGNAVNPAGGLYVNPYAQSLSGYQATNTSTLTAQLSLKQSMDELVPGLSARLMTYTTRYAQFSVARQYSPYYYTSNILNGQFSGISQLNDGNPGSPGSIPTEYLTYNPGTNTVNSTIYAEFALNYSHTFAEKHNVGGMLIGTIRNYLTGNASSLQLSLPSRNQGMSGRFTYGYDNRYLFEFDFGYNGSERFAANHRFGFFPSIGGGWIVSNEKFFKPLTNTISQLKFRFTYGLVGNDQIGDANDRFFYLSDVNLNGGTNGNFGTNYNYSRPSVAINRYENRSITWEKSKQLNLGLDMVMFKDFTITMDAYQQKRNNILMVRNTLPSSLGLQADVSANVGEVLSRGIDLALDYHHSFNNSMWIQARGTLTYAKNKLLANEEPIYPDNLKNLSRVGNSLGQIYGLVAERLFIDDVEVANSPIQSFGEYGAGDIKYRDINGDGKITNSDFVPMGFPTTPEIIYGAGFSVGYKNFDLSAFFQGSARSSFVINSSNTTPFYLNGGNQNGLLQIIADDHWSEDNRNSYAFWPRLSPTLSYNNNQVSSWWLQNGSFLRLKSVELGYNMSSKLLKKLGLANSRIYVNGLNLLRFSSFKLWDPEMGTSGLGYPVQRVFNIGILAGF